MRLSEIATEEGRRGEIGARLRAVRIARRMTLQTLAEEAGVAVESVRRLETGESAARLDTFLAVCRVLGLIDGLEAAIPRPEPSPIELVRTAGRPVQRVRERRKTEAPAWRWGDER